MKTQIKIDDKKVERALRLAILRGDDMSPVMRKIAGHLQHASEQSFETERSPSGKKWKPLSPVTLARKKNPGAKILHEKGYLAASILPYSNKTKAIAGTAMAYAATHQFGAKKGAFGTTRAWPDRYFSDLADAISDKVNNKTTCRSVGKTHPKPFHILPHSST